MFALLDSAKRREGRGGEGRKAKTIQSDRLGRVRRSPWQNVAGNIRESHLQSLLLNRGGIPGDVNFDYSQIQWQGLWPRHHPVLRSKTARKVSVDTIGCYRQPRSRRYIHGVHAIQPPKLQGEIGIVFPFTGSFFLLVSLLRYILLHSGKWYTYIRRICTFQLVILFLSFFFLFSSSSIDSRNLTFTIDPFNRSKAGRYLINKVRVRQRVVGPDWVPDCTGSNFSYDKFETKFHAL